MHNNGTRPRAGHASPNCACGAVLVGGTEQHAESCDLFDRSRDRRERDAAALADAPNGWALIRRVDRTEVDDLADAVGRVVVGRAELRRWRVRVAVVQLDGTMHIGRVFLRNGEPIGALVDSANAPAWSRS